MDTTEPSGPLPAPERIGPYLVLERIGEGGMGTVFAAMQEEPVRRKVALKIIKPGMDSAQVVARFEAERQALALMNHENIAQVYDGGVDESGRPYFAMEYVPGVPITEFCDRGKQTTLERLELFLDVCDAVQHAHQKGIIHRDLKPSNVLVTQRDDIPVPKVIDFGVARATNEPLTEYILHTRIDQIVGTLDYMSPEQADPSALDVDTRTDIYSLGVLLYQLLTGVLPFDAGDRATICEKDPPTPSTRLRQIGTSSTEIATKHGTDENALVHQLQGDLDWITMKALEKDRTRRYSSASDLAADLRRHLAYEPVLARPPSAGYRMRKFVRRNRTLVGAAALVVLALIAGVVGTTWGMLAASEQARLAGISQEQAERARQVADLERDDARKARDAERRQKEEAERAQAAEEGLRREADRASSAERDSRLRAERQAENARAATEFLVGILELANPEVSLQSELSMREVLDRASISVERSLAGQSEAEGSVRTTLGRAYLSIGELERAETHLRRALEILDASGTARPEDQYRVLWPLTRIAVGSAFFAPEDAEIGQRLVVLVPQMFGDEYAELRDAFPPPTSTDEPPDVAGIARLARADLRPGNPLRLVVADYLWLVGWYASLLGAPDEYTPPALEESLRIRRSELPERHPDIAATLNGLVELLNRAGRFDRAEELIQESLGIRRDVLPGDDVGIAASLSLLGECLAGQGRREEAEELLLSSYQTIREAPPPGHPEVVAALSRLVRVYEGWQEEEEARTHRRALARALTSSSLARKWPAPRLVFGPEHGTLYELLDRLQSQVERSGLRDSMRSDEFRAAIEELQATWRDSVTERERLLPAGHPLALLCAQYLTEWAGNIYGPAIAERRLENGAGEVAVCEAILRDSLAIQDEHPPQPRAETRYWTLWWLALICRREGRFQEGELLARQALSAAQRLDRGDELKLADAGCVLGACLVGQGRYAEAEPFVLGGALSMLEMRSITDGNVQRGCDGVRELYALWGDPRNADPVWHRILREAVDRGFSGEELVAQTTGGIAEQPRGGFILRTVQSVVATPGLEAGTYGLARDFVSMRLSDPLSEEQRRELLTQLLLTQLRVGGYEQVAAILPELDAGPGGATAVEWAAYAMALGGLGETDEAALALALAKDLLAEGGAGAAAARWIAESEAALR